MTAADLARAAWRVAVGEKVADRTVGVELIGKRLLVHVDDDIWRRQLFSLRQPILDRLAASLGPGVVEAMEVRVTARRIGPATAGLPAASADEADRILDPMLRHIYKSSRKRAMA